MRRIGIGTLGSVAGFFIALVITDLLASASMVRGGSDPSVVLGLVLGFLPLLCAALGAITALVVDTIATRRVGARREPPASDPDRSS